MPSNPERDVFAVWQEQPLEEARMTISAIEGKARELETQVWLRNGIEYIVAAILIIIHGALALTAPNPVERAGRALIVAAALSVAWQLHRRGSMDRMPSSLGATSCVEFYRAQLVRQRELFRSAWTWYLLPFIPGAVLVLIGSRLEGAPLSLVAGVVAFIVTIFVAVTVAHRQTLRKVQAKLDEL
jgi:hypothetical protein